MNMNFDKLNNIENEPINRILVDLCRGSEINNTQIYLVGGYIRDLILQRDCYDRDYVIIGESAVNFAKKAADFFQGYYVLLDKDFDIARVVLPDKKNTLDFAGAYKQDIFEDLKRRDYIINSIAYRIDGSKSGLIDPFSGLADLNDKIIKTISEDNLIDDPLRQLRAFRLSAQLGFEIEEKTLGLIDKNKKLINNISAERINAELMKMFESKHSAHNLLLMKKIEFLDELLPELTPQRSVPPNLHHHLCLIDHSIEVVNQVELNIQNLPQWVVEKLYSELSAGIKYISLLKMACLLHDLGKPATWQIDELGRHRFIKHEEIGAKMAVDLLKRLKFSKKAIKYITNLIKYHLYPSQIIRHDEEITEKSVMKLFRKIGDETPETIFLAMADRLSAQGPEITEEVTNANIKGLFRLLEKYKESKEKVVIPPLLSGHEIMKLLNIPKGPQVGKIVKALREAQNSGDINTKEEAVSFINNYKLC